MAEERDADLKRKARLWMELWHEAEHTRNTALEADSAAEKAVEKLVVVRTALIEAAHVGKSVRERVVVFHDKPDVPLVVTVTQDNVTIREALRA